MRLRLFIAIVIGLAAALGAWAVHVLYLDIPAEIKVGDYVVDAPLTVVVISLVLAAVALLICWKLLSLILFFPAHLRRWRQGRRSRRQTRHLADGLKAIALGTRPEQYKNFLAAADAGVAPDVNYYLAAAASVDNEKRHASLLRKAARTSDGDPMIQAMATARARLASNQPAEAAEVLRLAGAVTSKGIQPLRLLLEATEKSGDYRGALDVAQQLLQRDKSPAMKSHVGKITRTLLDQTGDPDDIRGLIGSIDTSSSSETIAIAAADRLAAVKDTDSASKILAQALTPEASAELLEAVARNGDENLVRKTLSTMDDRISNQTTDTGMLRAIAHLAIREKIWGKARALLEQAQQVKSERATFLRMAQLAEAEDKGEQLVNQLYRQAAEAAD